MKTLIGIPAMSWVYTDFMKSMLALDKPDAQLMIQTNTLIYDARCNIALAAAQNGFDRVLWLDSDMQFEPDLLVRLNADMDRGFDLVSGYYTGRTPAMNPCIYKKLEYEINGDEVHAAAIPYIDHPQGLFEIAACGFGAVLTTVDLLKAVIDKFGAPFLPAKRLGEDLSFCWRAGQLGAKMFCDAELNVGHIGTVIFKEEGQCSK